MVLWRIKHLEDNALVDFEVFAGVYVGLEALWFFVLVLGDPVRAMCSLLRQKLTFYCKVDVFELLGHDSELENIIAVWHLNLVVGWTGDHVLCRTIFI